MSDMDKERPTCEPNPTFTSSMTGTIIMTSELLEADEEASLSTHHRELTSLLIETALTPLNLSQVSLTSDSPILANLHQVEESTNSNSNGSAVALDELLPTSSSGVAAVAHVYAADVGVSLQNETVDAIHYDDATQLLMIIKGGVVFAYDLTMDAPGHHEQLVWTYPLQEGPRVMSMRCSLDRTVLGCLRGHMLLELVELTTGITTVYKPSSERSDLLGFFFTEAPGADVVLVSRSGLELCEFASRQRGLRKVDRLCVNPSWYLWTHETRCCVVATGGQGQYIQAWQFVSGGIVTLPPFLVGSGAGSGGAIAAGTLIISGGAALPISLPLSFPVPPQAGLGASSSGSTTGTLSHRHVRLLKMYGRVYCAYINTSTSKLELYRFFTDSVVLQHTYQLFSTNIDLSVVDQVLILHHLDTAITVLVDVAADPEDMPVANPLPLAVLHPPPPPPRQPLPPVQLSPPPYQPSYPSPRQAPLPPKQQLGPRGVRHSGSLEITQWEFIPPSTIIDRGHQAVYRLYIDLRAVAESCGNPVLLASFLQRRREPALPELSVVPKQLLLESLRSCLMERLPTLTLRLVFQQLCRAWVDVTAAVAKSGGKVSSAVTAAVLSPDEIALHVFKWVRSQEQMVASLVDGNRAQSRHLQFSLSEYLVSCLSCGLSPPESMFKLQADLMQHWGQHDQATLLVYGVINQIAGISSQASGVGATQGAVHSLEQIALLSSVYEHLNTGMVEVSLSGVRATRPLVSGCFVSNYKSEGSEGEDSSLAGESCINSAGALVLKLLESGRVLEAARAALRLRVTTVHPKELLRAAAERQDEVAFASIYRCFRDALMPFYPKLEVARALLMQESQVA